MNGPLFLRFESTLFASRERLWEWITSIQGISTEVWPLFRMTVPKSIRSLADVQTEPGIPMFRSYILLFGFVPIDYSDLTLLELTPGFGFVEQSPMGSMKLWRHVRTITPHPSSTNAVLLVDELTFQPRFAKRFVGRFIQHVFTHRHTVLRRRFEPA